MTDPLYSPILETDTKAEPEDDYIVWQSDLELQLAKLMRHIEVIKMHLGGDWPYWYDRYDRQTKGVNAASESECGKVEADEIELDGGEFEFRFDELDFGALANEQVGEDVGEDPVDDTLRDRVVSIIDDQLTLIPLSTREKDYLVEAVWSYPVRFRGISINLEAGGVFSITKYTPEDDSGWSFFWFLPDPSKEGSYTSITYTLRPDGTLVVSSHSDTPTESIRTDHFVVDDLEIQVVPLI